MNSYWVNFIKTGNPNGPGLPKWTAATASNTPIVQRVGNAFEQIPPASLAQVQLFKDWFSGLKIY